MSEKGVLGASGVGNDDVWRLTKRLFLASSLLFLVNIGLGFVNAVTTGPIPRWQFLTHLHAGTLGWITLSVIAIAIWLATGDRAVSETYVRRVRWLGWIAVVAIVGTIGGFALGFSQGGAFWYLLAASAPVTALAVWAAAVLALTQLRRREELETALALVTGGLFVGALGVTMGAILGVENAVGGVVPLPYDLAIGVHQASIDFFLLLVAGGLVEWYVRDDGGEWTRGGKIQTTLGVAPPVLVAAFAVALGGTDIMGPALLVTVLGGFVGYMIAFVVRTGRQAVRIDPRSRGPGPWFFFGSIWLVVYVLGFVPTGALPNGLVVNYHVEFLGMATNVLLGVLSVRTMAAEDRYAWAEPSAVWLMNGGMVLFFALEVAMGSRHGAIVMGLGVLLAVLTMIDRLLTDGIEAPTPSATDTTAR